MPGRPQSELLTSLCEGLYEEIFLADGGRNTSRSRRVRVLEAFLCNLMVAIPQLLATRLRRGCVLVHLNKTRYSGTGINYDHVKKIYRYLKKQRLVYVTPGYHDPSGKNSKVTRMIPTQKLYNLLLACVPQSEIECFVATRPERPVVLRDKDRHPLAYKETKSVRQLIRDINHINAANDRFEVSCVDSDTQSRLPVNTYIYAVFNENWRTAGRFYGGRRSHVNLTRAERETMLIDGQPIVELDYKSLHIMLLYAKVGRQYKGDPYGAVAPGAQRLRPILKEILLSLLNDKCSEPQAINHLNHRLLRGHTRINESRYPLEREEAERQSERNRRLLDDHGIEIAELVRKFKAAHRPIARFFHTGIWAEMQNADSRIARRVMLAMVRKKLPCLPRHDSFVTQARHKDKLFTAMTDAYRAATKRLFGVECAVEIETRIA
jgi:hypothetical protein